MSRINGFAGLQRAFGATFDDDYNERKRAESEQTQRELDYSMGRWDAAELMRRVARTQRGWPEHEDGSFITIKEMSKATKLLEERHSASAGAAKRALAQYKKELKYLADQEVISAADVKQRKG